MTIQSLMCCIVLAATACKSDGHPATIESSGSAVRSVSDDHIRELGRSCRPDARAGLVIAAASGTDQQRCEAMTLLARRGPEGFSLNSAFLTSAATALEQPDAARGLRAMLADKARPCSLERHEAPVQATPRQVALWLLADVPVSALRGDVEALPPDADRDAAIRSYDYAANHQTTAAAGYVDSLTADASPEGFRHLVAFVAGGFPWPDFVPKPSADALAAVHVRVVAALQWLAYLASPAPDDPDASLECVQNVKEAIRTGPLGKDLLASFDRLDPVFRYNVLSVFSAQARPDARTRLEQIASSDPDKDVRGEAHLALSFFDIGGSSALKRTSVTPGGAGSGDRP